MIPGFDLSMGATATVLSLTVLIPLFSVFLTLSGSIFADFWRVVTGRQTVATYRVSLSCAGIVVVISALFGVLLAWILIRYQSSLRRVLDGLIELLFTLPTTMAGVSLTTMYSDKSWIDSWFDKTGIEISCTTTGIVIAMIFIGVPFVVRSIQPVLERPNPQYEEAALTLGASRSRIFSKVIFPKTLPVALASFGLAFARCIGEYGSVVFITGNIPHQTQITPLIIMNKLEQFSYIAATPTALVMVVSTSLLLFGIDLIQAKVNQIARG